MAHLGTRAFDSIEVRLIATAFVLRIIMFKRRKEHCPFSGWESETKLNALKKAITDKNCG